MRRNLLMWVIALMCFCPSAAQQLYTADELDELVGPVAMYPDPLLSNVLTGATEPDQIQRAQVYLQSGKPVTKDEPTGFDTSVHALMSYPDVIGMMAENQDWTSAIGWASANQLSDVMEAVQRFRYQAKTAGSLVTNDKVQVIEEGTVIRIEPANPQVIYVPSYDPATVVVSQPNGFGTFLTYSAAIATNVLLWDRVFNWHDYRCYRTPYGWYPPADYYRPYGGNAVYRSANVNVWAPNRNTYINRPVNINNQKFNNINYRGGGNKVVNRPATRPVVNTPANRVQPKNNPRVSQHSRVTNRRTGERPPVVAPNRPVNQPNRPNVNRPVNQPATRPNVNRPANRPVNQPATRPNVNRPANRPSTRPDINRGGASNYSRTGGTVRASQRGASSRGTPSYSGGGGGARPGRPGGRRR